MHDVFNNIEEYNLGKKYKILIVFDDMITAMINNKKTKSSSDWNFYERQKIKHFNCPFHTIILQSVKRC